MQKCSFTFLDDQKTLLQLQYLEIKNNVDQHRKKKFLKNLKGCLPKGGDPSGSCLIWLESRKSSNRYTVCMYSTILKLYILKSINIYRSIYRKKIFLGKDLKRQCHEIFWHFVFINPNHLGP